eukprot:c52216_g1_i1.p1 GENE.c52216_g1_i1~~c52216_g1_i1.p1  ORF type:complete len:375 (-),score=58.34 c52216_g1_i1:41-1165(-)
MRHSWVVALAVCVLAFCSALPTATESPSNAETPTVLANPALEKTDAGGKADSYEVSRIKERIFEDDEEKARFLASSGKEKIFHNNSVWRNSTFTYQDRVKSCVGTCGEGMRLFTVWTTSLEGWNDKYTRSIDSALYHHPKAKVSIYSSSLPSEFLNDFVELGYNVSVEKIKIVERAEGTPLAPWTERLEKWRTGPFYYAHLSDAMRLLVLYNEGGIYFDTDFVFISSLDNTRNAVGLESQDSICNAVMAFDAKNPFLRDVLQQFNDKYDPTNWAGNGPDLLTSVFLNSYRDSNLVKVLERPAFYMIGWDEVQHYFKKESPADLQRDLAILHTKGLGVHFWNSRTHDLIPSQDSVIEALFSTNCVYCRTLSGARI